MRLSQRPENGTLEDAMDARKIAGLIAVASLASVAPARAGDLELFGSPLMWIPATGYSHTVRCQFTNIGDTPILLKRARMFDDNGRTVDRPSGSPNIELAPGQTGSFGGSGSNIGIGCRAETNKKSIVNLRGTISRDDFQMDARPTARMSRSSGDFEPMEFTEISSPISSTGFLDYQNWSDCRITNIGNKDVTVTAFNLVYGGGGIVPGTRFGCSDDPTFTLRPGRSCGLKAPFYDLRCRAIVNRKGAVRGVIKVFMQRGFTIIEEMGSLEME